MIIIFGATGDLTKRKLLPAINNLHKKGLIDCPVICIGRRDISNTEYIKLVGLKSSDSFSKLIHYFKTDLTESNNPLFVKFIKKEFKEHKCKGKLFYFAIPQKLFKPVIDLIKASKLLSGGWNRVVFEKPFGYDLVTAKELNKQVSTIFKEKDIYRIDHFLGKELVQNIQVLRFTNSIFEQMWSNEFIDNVQVIMDEKVLVGSRGGYYDNAGAVRDMVQNHAMQILSLIAMEPPKRMTNEEIIKEKIKVLKALKPVKPSDIVLGQYKGYRGERGVDPHSDTETFTALKFNINNDRWKGVPFYIRTGKALSKSLTEVNLVLKRVKSDLICKNEVPNIISIRIKPEEGVSIRFNNKLPGHGLETSPVKMDFCHRCLFDNNPEAYEVLIHEVFMGNKGLFTSWDEVVHSWKFIDDLLSKNGKVRKYERGSSGSMIARKLLSKDRREWVEIN